MATNLDYIDIETLKKLSKDTNNSIIVCNCKNYFINFDKLKKKLMKKRKYRHEPSSPDMLFINDREKEIWFVEFKSSNLKNLKKEKEKEKVRLKRKILDGLIIFYELFQNYFDYKKFYFVVFNKNSSYEDELIDAITDKPAEFDLEELNGKFLENVFTDNCEVFKKIFSQRFNIKFDCVQDENSFL